LQQEVIAAVREQAQAGRSETFATISALAVRAAGSPPRPMKHRDPAPLVPSVTEPWYCCAEPDAELI
jgi:hypothetical protein